MTTRPRVGIDLDGCVYDFERTARYMLRAQFHYRKDGPMGSPSTHWDYIEEHVQPEEWQWLWNEGVKNGLFKHGHLFTGAIEGLKGLSYFGDLVVITHRPAKAVQDTLEWLAYNRFPLREVHILTEQQPKSSVPCDIYIDDGPHVLRELKANAYINGIKSTVVRMERPWNSQSGGNSVSSWDDAVQFVQEDIEEWSAYERFSD